MKRQELIQLLRERISEKYPQPVLKKAIPEIVDEIFSIMREELSRGQDIRIPKFGTFKFKEVKKEGQEEVKRFIRFIPAK